MSSLFPLNTTQSILLSTNKEDHTEDQAQAVMEVFQADMEVHQVDQDTEDGHQEDQEDGKQPTDV